MSLFLTYMFVLNFVLTQNTRSSTRPAKISKKYLQCTWILTVSGTRGVRRLSRKANCNPAKAALKKAFQIYVILGFQISETKTLLWRCTSIGRA